jgi:hypothetical protein
MAKAKAWSMQPRTKPGSISGWVWRCRIELANLTTSNFAKCGLSMETWQRDFP